MKRLIVLFFCLGLYGCASWTPQQWQAFNQGVQQMNQQNQQNLDNQYRQQQLTQEYILRTHEASAMASQQQQPVLPIIQTKTLDYNCQQDCINRGYAYQLCNNRCSY